MSDFTTTLPATLKAARQELGMTCCEVAAAIGTTPGSIHHYEAGRNVPSLVNFKRLCDVLYLCADDVLGAA